MRILITGSFRTSDETSFAQFKLLCNSLGEKLADGKHCVLVCSSSDHTADKHIVAGMIKSKTKPVVEVYFPMSDGSEMPYKDSFSTPVDLKYKPCQGGFRVVHLNCVQNADVVIAIGGSDRGTGTLYSIYSAELLEKPVALIPYFGGAAKETWDYFNGRYYGQLNAGVFSNPTNPNFLNWATDILEAVKQLAKRNPFLRKNAFVGVISSIFALGAVGGWLYLFFSGIPENVPLRVCLMMGTSSVVGSMLRILGREAGLLDADISVKRPVIAAVTGLLVGFALFLLAEFSNLTLNGKEIPLEKVENINRMALTMSPLLLLASLLLESAWAKLISKGSEQITSI